MVLVIIVKTNVNFLQVIKSITMSGSGNVTNWILFDRSVGSGIEVTHTNVRKDEYKKFLFRRKTKC